MKDMMGYKEAFIQIYIILYLGFKCTDLGSTNEVDIFLGSINFNT